MRWKCVRGRDPDSKNEYFVLVQDDREGYTAYEMQTTVDDGTVQVAVDKGVPIYYTYDNVLREGPHAWWVNNAAEKCGQGKNCPVWMEMNCTFKTYILQSENMDSIEDRKIKRPGPPPEVPPKRAKTSSGGGEMKS